MLFLLFGQLLETFVLPFISSTWSHWSRLTICVGGDIFPVIGGFRTQDCVNRANVLTTCLILVIFKLFGRF